VAGGFFQTSAKFVCIQPAFSADSAHSDAPSTTPASDKQTNTTRQGHREWWIAPIMYVLPHFKKFDD